MNYLKPVAARIAFALLLVVGLTPAASAAPPAATSTFRIFIDDAPGGCAQTTTLGSPLLGIDEIVTIKFTFTAPPSSVPALTSVTRQDCSGTILAPPPPLAFGATPGPGNLTSIETSVPLATIPANGVRLYFDSIYTGNTAPGNMDELLTLDGTGGGLPIVVKLLADIPTLGEWGLLLLALLLGGSGFVLMRRQGNRRRTVAGFFLIVLALGAGAAWAATLVVDGDVSEWTTVNATDAIDSATPSAQPNADIVEGFGAIQGSTLFIRLDVKFSAAPVSNSAPVVTQPLTFSIPENSPNGTVVGTVTFTDADAGQSHTFSFATGGNPGNAFAIDPSTGQITVADSTALDFETTPTFTLTVQVTDDGTPQQMGTGTVTVNLTNVDDVNPTAVNDAATVAEDSPATAVAVLANDTDADGGAKSIASVTQPANGVVVITGGGTGLTYQPNPGYCNNPSGSPDTFTYTLTPGGSTATVSMTVNCVDDPPTAVADAATVNEDAPATAVDVLSNDPDSDGGPKSIASVTQPSNGTVVITGGGSGLTYQPNPDYCNSVSGPADTFTYTLAPAGPTPTATVSMTVTCINDAPVLDLDANDDQGTTGSDFAVTFTEGDAPKLIEDPADATVTDVDNTTLASLTVTITNVLDPGFETLSTDVTGTSITANYVPATGVLTLTGPDTVANFQTVLRKVRYQNTDVDPNTTPRVIHFVANDGVANSNTATSTVTLVAVDTPPAAVNDSATVNEDAPATAVPVLANDTDPDGGPRTIQSVTQPANGVVVITGGGTGLTYQPAANYCNSVSGSPDTFTYTLAQGGPSPTATVSMTVTCVNDAPVLDLDANDDKGTTGSDFAVTFTEGDAATLIEDPADATVTDVDNATLASLTVTITNILDPGFETLSADVTGTSITANYVPATGVLTLTGPDTLANFQTVLRKVRYQNTDDDPSPAPRVIQFVANDGTVDSNTATSTVTVVPVDDAPTAVADAATVSEDSGANAIDVLANDTDPDLGPKSIQSVTQPANGTVVITGGGTGLTYQPTSNYCNSVSGTPDTFTYTLAQGGPTPTATVSVTVTCMDDPPIAVADAATVSEDAPATAVDVLSNDTDADGGPKTILSVTQPANGTVVITGGGTGLTYQPAPNYCNSVSGPADTFTYTLAQGGPTPTATVSMTVTCVNDAPVLDLDANDDQGTTGSDFAATFTEGDPAKLIEDPVDATVTDVDNTTLASLTVTITNILDPGFETLSADVTGTSITANYVPATGVLTLTGPDTLANFQMVLRKVRYQNTDVDPDPTPRVIHFVANDGTANSNTATSTVTVVPVDTPPTAVADSATVNEDAPATAIPVLTNDTDPDGGPKSIQSVTQPANGTVVITGGGTGLTYKPNADYCNSVSGPADTFTYTLTPAGPTPTATVSMTVTCQDDPPVAVNDAATVTEDDPATAINVLANDTDVDGGPKSIASVTQPANGAVVITGGGSGLTYQPNPNYCNSVSGPADTFTYTLTPAGPTPTATVSVTVTCVDDPPVAVNDAATVVEDSGANAINVLANDTDIDAGPKSIQSVTQPANGVVTITGGGTGLTYTPNANYCNSTSGPADTFTYTLTPAGATPTATVSVTVTCVNDPPSDIALSNAAVNENQPVNTVVGTFSTTDPDIGDTHTYTLVAGAGSTDNGSFNISGAQLRTSAMFNFEVKNSYSIRVRTTDSGGLFFEKVFTITVNDLPEAPIPGNDTYDTIGNTELRVDRPAGPTPNVKVTSPVSPSNLGVLDNDVDEDNGQTNTLKVSAIVGCADTTAPFGDGPVCNTANGGTVLVQDDGSFSYIPKAGDTAASDSFQYTVSDTTSLTATGTVTINRRERVWYVKNDAVAGGLGRSTDPFDTLAEAQAASLANDYIFVYFGDGTNTGQTAGIALKNGQHLLGELSGLTVTFSPAITFNGAAGTTSVQLLAQPGPTACSGNPCRPLVDNPAAGGNAVSATDVIPVEIAGLSLSGNTNGIDVTHTAAFAGSGSTDIRDNVVRSAGAEGIDINKGGTGALSLSLHDNTVTAGGNGIDVLRTNGGLAITAFANNAVTGNTGGSGIVVTGPASFDSNTSNGTNDTVSGGSTVIGASGNGVGANGMVLTNVSGDLQFTDLDIYNDAGSGLVVTGTGALTASTGTRVLVASGTSTFDSKGGPAIDINNASISFPSLAFLRSLNSTTTGLSLVNAFGGVGSTALSASSGQISDPAGASGTAVNISGGNGNITLGIPITNTSGNSVVVTGRSSDTVSFSSTISDTGSGISLTSNGGATISFTGAITASTGANPAFTATGGGTVTSTDTTSTLATTTGTALNVANTQIGSGGLIFKSISAGTAAGSSGNGITLDNTGTAAGNGGLTVQGGGTAGSGGTIQHKTGADSSTTGGIGIYLNNTKNPSFNRMQLNDFDNFAIYGAGVQGFTLNNSVINGVNGNNDGVDEAAIRFDNLLVSGSISNSTIEGGVETNIRVINNTGTLNALVIQNSTIRNNSPTTGGDGIFARAQAGATMTVKVIGCTLYGHRDDHIATDAENSGVMTTVITGNTLTSNGTIGAPPQASTLGGQITVTGGAAFSSTSTFNISNNIITGAVPAPITVNVTSTTSTASGLLSGSISGNQLGQAGSANSGSSTSDGMSVIVNGAATVNATITNNQIRQFNNIGIQFIKRDGAGNMNVTATGNTVAEPVAPNALQGILVTSGATSGPPADSGTVCADIGGAGALVNTVTGPNFGGDLIRVRQRFSTIVRLPGYGGGATDTTAVTNYLTGRNTITNEAPNAKASATTQAPGSFAGGAACTAGAAPL